MSVVWAICRRDLIHHFTTPLAWLILACWTLITNGVFYMFLYWAKQDGGSGVPLYHQSLTAGAWCLILLAPAVTMNSFASERMQGTLQLLFTVPVHDRQLVLGKFLAAFLMLLTLVAATLIQVVVLYFVSDIGGLQMLAGYLALVLLAAFFAAIGTWISLLVDSSVAAYVITMSITAILFLGGWLLGDPGNGAWAPVQAVAAFIGIEPRLIGFRSGDVALGDIAWFIGMTAIFLVLARSSLGARRIHG